MRTINDLPEALELKGTDQLVFVKDGFASRITLADFALHAPEINPPSPWTNFIDLTNTSNLAQLRDGTGAVTTAGDRIGYVSGSNGALAEVDGLNTRWTLRNDGTYNYAEITGDTYLEDTNENGWIVNALNNRDPWWLCLVIHADTVTEADNSLALLQTRLDGSNTDVRVSIDRDSSGPYLRIRRRLLGATNSRNFPLPEILNGPLCVSAGYDGSVMTVRANLETKLTAGDERSLPRDGTGYNGAWMGGSGWATTVARVYSIGFLNRYPSAQEEEACIREALGLIGADPDTLPEAQGNDYDEIAAMAPVALYDVSVTASLAQDAGNTTAVTAHQDPVAYLADLSGSNHASTGISGQRPIYQVKGDGTFSLRFDSTQARLNIPGLDTLFDNTNTWWAAFAVEQITNGAGFVLIGKQHSDAPNRYSTHLWLGHDQDGTWPIIERVQAGSFVDTWVMGPELEVGSRGVVIGSYNGAQISVQVPPGSPVTSNDSRSLGTANTVPTHLGGNALTGMTAEIYAAAIFNRIPSGPEQTAITNWLLSKVPSE